MKTAQRKKVPPYLAGRQMGVAGFCCPNCQAPGTAVYDTRSPHGFPLRRRLCTICGRRFRTEEVLIGEVPQTFAARMGKQLNAIRGQVAALGEFLDALQRDLDGGGA